MKKSILLVLFLILLCNCFAEINTDIAVKELNSNIEVKRSGVYSKAFEIPEVLLPQEYIDHPEKILDKVNNKKKMYILNKLARDNWKRSYPQSIEYGNEALKAAQDAHLDYGIIISYITLAKTYLLMDDFEKASVEYLNAENVIMQQRDKKELLEIYDGLTEVWESAGKMEKALEYAEKSMQIRKNSEDLKKISDQYNNIGNIYFRNGMYEEALENYYKAFDIDEKQNNKLRLPLIQHNLAVTYFKLGAYPEALININKLLEADQTVNQWEVADGLIFRGFLLSRMAKYDFALKDYQNAFKVFSDIKDFSGKVNSLVSIGNVLLKSDDIAKAEKEYLKAKELAEKYGHKRGLAAVYNNLGIIAQMNNDYKNSVDNLLISLEMEKEENNKIGIIISQYNLGNIYLKLSNYDNSVSSFLNGLEISKQLNEKFIIKEIYQKLAELYAEKKQYKTALEYHKKFAQMNYELNVEDLQTRYEVGRKRFEIELLKKQNTILKLQRSRLSIGLVSLIILVLLMIWVNQSKSKTNKLLKIEINEHAQTEKELKLIKEELEERVNIRTAELSKLNESLQREVAERKQYQEKLEQSLEEKDVMMKEIHHRVKNNMQVISSLLRMQANYIDEPGIVEAFNDSFHRVKSMSLIHEKLYRSDDLAHIDFQDYVESLTRLLYNTYTPSADLKLDIDLKGIFLDINIAIPCGLIINELITNSLKYAFKGRDKGKISVKMTQDLFEGLNLIVQDDGVGLPDDFKLEKTKSLGMRLVYLLAEDQLDGKVNVDNNNGTSFEISFSGISD